MGEEETKKIESEATVVAAPPPPPPPQETPADEKAPKVSPPEKTLDPSPDDKVSASKTPAIVEKVSDPPAEKISWDSVDRDAALTRVETEKRLALIKAWEESEKTKAENKAWKKLSTIGAWESSKKASIEAQLKKIEEDFEKKKAEYAEKISNKTAEIRRAAEEKRAMVEAKRGEDILKVEEAATKFRTTGNLPRRFFGCFTG